MAEADVTPLPERAPPIPDTLTLTSSMLGDTRFSPNELRALKIQTGRGLTELVGPDAEDADRFQTLVWLRLRREGRPALDWNELGDVDLAFESEPDPTDGGSRTTGPPSAGSGG